MLKNNPVVSDFIMALVKVDNYIHQNVFPNANIDHRVWYSAGNGNVKFKEPQQLIWYQIEDELQYKIRTKQITPTDKENEIAFTKYLDGLEKINKYINTKIEKRFRKHIRVDYLL